MSAPKQPGKHRQVLILSIDFDPDDVSEPASWDWTSLLDEEVTIVGAFAPTPAEVEP